MVILLTIILYEMKRIALIASFMFIVMNIYSQTNTSDLINGNWYKPDDNTLKPEVNQTMSFTKNNVDSHYLKWTFDKDGTFTCSFAMDTPHHRDTPDHNDIISYKSKPVKWILEDDKDIVHIEDIGQDQEFKILTLEQTKLVVQRIK